MVSPWTDTASVPIGTLGGNLSRCPGCQDVGVGTPSTPAAAQWSERDFRELVEPYRRELHLHCYRMTGSVADAEDMLQETLIAAWRGLERFAGRSSIRTWLYRVATNCCLNAIRSSRRRMPAEPVPPFDPPPPSRRSEVTWLQPYPDALLDSVSGHEPGPAERWLSRETVELAFLTALQQLPPRQAAVLLMVDVLDFSAAEVAPMLDTTATAIKGVLQRARASVARLDPETAHSVDTSQERDVARRFAQAFTHDDVDAVVALLTDDAWLAMPPAPHTYDGPAAVRAFLNTSVGWRSGRRRPTLIPTDANCQPAFGCYLADPDAGEAQFTGIVVLTVRGDQIAGVTRFLDPELGKPFGMPDVIEPQAAG
jgi:RNA polymerase sigma-70 factor (TIGR02960 family)